MVDGTSSEGHKNALMLLNPMQLISYSLALLNTSFNLIPYIKMKLVMIIWKNDSVLTCRCGEKYRLVDNKNQYIWNNFHFDLLY